MSERCIGSLKSPNGNIIELCEGESGYFTRLYIPESDSDHALTPQEATDFLAVIRSCGGTVNQYIASPRDAASQEGTP